MNNTGNPATINDIATACGVSRWTVSAVLFPSAKNQHVGCGEATRKKVFAAARRLKYRPHRASRNLHVRKHGVLGILTTQFYTIPWNSIRAMLDAAKRHDQLISFESFASGDEVLPILIRESVVDGLMIYEPIAPAIERAIDLHRIPAVYVNTCQRGKVNSINMDEAGAIAQAVNHLAGQGRKHLTLIVIDGAGHGTELFELQRIAAFKRACARARMVAPTVLSFRGFQDIESSHRHLAEFFGRNGACDGVIAPNDQFVGMLYQLFRKTGRSIPGDVAVVCMQNQGRLMNYDPPVTAFDLPEHSLGTLAVETLNRVISTHEDAKENLLAYEFIIRPSTG